MGDSFRYHHSTSLARHYKLRNAYAPVTGSPTGAAFAPHHPVLFDIWRSVTVRLLDFYYFGSTDGYESSGFTFGTHISQLQPYPVGNQGPLISLARPGSHRRDSPIYGHSRLEPGRSQHTERSRDLKQLTYKLPKGPFADSKVQQFLDNTTHTSNDVLSAQVNCHSNLSFHEFISFGHLRSGGSLQWINILRELRSRTLNFRHPEVHLLFSQACSQVGPLGNGGEFVWHQELQDASFCCALLDELESLFVDDGIGSSDGPVMATISLLACLLASRANDDISERAIELLRNVRGKTFDWVHQLLYDLYKSPGNEECWRLLRDTAAVCRSTFDVGPVMIYKLLRSTQDIEAVLSCAILIHTGTIPTDKTGFSGVSHPLGTFNDSADRNLSGLSMYSRTLLERDRRLGLVLEGALRDAIQADVSDMGVDLAVRKVWSGYCAGPRRW